MKKNLFIVGAVIFLGIFAAVAWVLRPPAEATSPIEAIPLSTPTTAVVSEESAAEPTQEEATTEGTDSYPAPEQAAVQAESGYPAPEETSGTVLFTIVQAESEVRFTLSEELRGVPTTVIGATDQVAGEISIDLNNPANTQLGTIQVNARTVATDNNFRNRAIQNEILQTGSFEFITFTPTSLSGLPASIAVGETVSFEITGDLTIRDITQTVTFDVTATLVAADRLEGLASVLVTRTAFSLSIPSVPNVANVSDEVLVELEFVAVPK